MALGFMAQYGVTPFYIYPRLDEDAEARHTQVRSTAKMLKGTVKMKTNSTG